MKDVFDANPNVNELIVFPDGNCFENNELGKNMAHNYGFQTKQESTVVNREEVEEVEEVKTKTKK